VPLILGLADFSTQSSKTRADQLLEVVYTQIGPRTICFCADGFESVLQALAYVVQLRESGKEPNYELLEITEECLREVRFAVEYEVPDLRPLSSNALGVMYTALQYIPWQRQAPNELHFVAIDLQTRQIRFWPLSQVVNPPRTICYAIRRCIYTSRTIAQKPLCVVRESVLDTAKNLCEVYQFIYSLRTSPFDAYL